MDSPESAKDANTTNSAVTSLSESPQVQESPFFRYINNLSPIKPVKAVHLAQGFSGFSSPPPLFTSPRISSHRGTQFLKRPQCCQSSSAGISQNDDGGKNSIDNPDDFNKSNSLLVGKSITDNQKGFDIKNDENTQNCSSSLCVDEFLADPGDIDGMYSVSPSVKQSNDAVESSISDLTHSKETISKYDNKNGLIETEESKEVHLENPTCDDEPRNIEGKKNSIEWSSTEFAKLKSNLSAELLSQKQHCEDSSAQVLQECEDCGKMGPTSHVCAENMMQDGSEASLKHRGLLRRCLQFEEAASTAFGSSKNSLLPAHIPEDSRSSATSSESKNLKASHMTTIATSSKRHMVKLSESNNSSFSPQLSHLSGNVPVKSSKPSGIGLHLNSIVNAMPLGCAATTEMGLAEGSMGQQAMKTASSISLNKGGNINRCLIPSDVNGKSSVYTKEGKHEIIAPMASGSVISESPSTIDSSNMLNPIGHPASINGKRKLSSQDAGYVEEFNQPFPEKKRKKTSSSSDDDGCKRCNCKKSKCLKLYCDCFAAGIYCAEPCACQGCFNRPEYEDTVLETRQQIESRNPLAFAPKIVQHATEIPSNNVEDANLTTPSSARHKRGCNCKRSMCLKKYCECYQANVGCSTACRCDGCKNVYGRKEDFFATEHALSKERLSNMVEKGSDSTFHKKLEMVANKADFSHAELYDLQNLSPLTPSLQCSDEGKEAAKSRLLAGKYLLPSPHSDVSTFSSHGKFAKSPKNSEGSLVLQETNEMVGTAASYDLQSDCNNVEILDQSSRRHNLVTNTCQLTPLSNPSLMALPSISSKARDCTTLPQSQLSHGSTRVLSGSSLRWRSSPITPMTRLGETKHLQSYESDSRRLSDILEDETPEVLKETSTPTKSVKASSPNQKRVSPPHHAVEPGSISSGGLRSGRKFILKAVPSFPPLTPCMDSEGTSNTSHDNSGTNSSSK